MMTFEEYIKKEDEEVKEDEMVAAISTSDGVVSAQHGTTDADVLGKCDHDKCGGFFKKNCFHVPKPIFKQPLSRLNKKKHKKFYLAEVEMPVNIKTILSKLSEDRLMTFIADNYDISYYDIYEIADVAWVYDTQTLYIKFYELETSSYSTKFIEFKIVNGKLIPEDKGSQPLSANNALKTFKQKYPHAKNNFQICWK